MTTGGRAELPGSRAEKAMSSTELKLEVEKTRCQMDETLHELGRRLQPRQLLNDAFQAFSRRSGDMAGATLGGARSAGERLMRAVREHPIPSFLIGAGIAWWIAEGVRGRPARIAARGGPSGREPEWRGAEPIPASAELHEPGAERTEASGSAKGSLSRASSAARNRLRQGISRASGVAQQALARVRARTAKMSSAAAFTAQEQRARASRTAASAVERLKESASRALSSTTQAIRSGVSRTARATKETMMQGVERISRKTRQTTQAVGQGIQRGVARSRDRASHTFEEHPLLVGAAALGLGIGIGLLLPRTRREDRVLGKGSDQLKEAAKERGEEILERGKRVVQATGQRAMEASREEGLTPGQLREKAQDVVREAREEALETARQEGLAPGTGGET